MIPPDPPKNPSGSPQDFLTRVLRDYGGAIPFEHFMREALYHPEYGYYSRHALTVGRGGDFSTTATLHPILGNAIAKWLIEQRSLLLGEGPWHVIELGAGSGELAQAILRNLGWWHRRKLHYHIVEASPRFTQAQKRLLSGYAISWHQGIEEPLKQSEGKTLIFSNEFVDAFPCRLLQRVNENWTEVWLTQGPGGVVEEFRPLQKVVDSEVLQLIDPSVIGPQRVEIFQSYLTWLRAWSPLFQKGAMLSIDYGDTASDLYYRRPRGTLRAFFQHQRFQGEEVYHRFGRQDLTADVNFTHLIGWGEAQHWHTQSYETQRCFLMKYCPDAEKEARKTPALAFLLDPNGPGDAFKVLHQIR